MPASVFLTLSAAFVLTFKLRSLRSVAPPNGAATPVYAVTRNRPTPRRLNSRLSACITADLPVPPAPDNDADYGVDGGLCWGFDINGDV